MPWNWGACVNKISDWAFSKAGGFGKYNGWGSVSAAAGPQPPWPPAPACLVGGFFTDSGSK